MMELIAGLLVAIAALAYILEPLTHRAAPAPRHGSDQAAADPETLVAEMRKRLVSRCPACGAPSDPGQAFCVKCGRILVSE